jgi:lipopolysaccharide/colanic/teichoic acid biosynthesis glycosyltransferase
LKLGSRLGDLRVVQTLEAGSGGHEVVRGFDGGFGLRTDHNPLVTVLGRARVLGRLAIGDALCVVFALLLANHLALSGQPMDPPYAFVSLAAPLLWVSIFAAFRLYSARHRSMFEQLKGIVGARSLSLKSRQLSAALPTSATFDRASRYLHRINRHGLAARGSGGSPTSEPAIASRRRTRTSLPPFAVAHSTSPSISWGGETSVYQAHVASAAGVFLLGIATFWWLPGRSMGWLLATWMLVLGFDLPTRVIQNPVGGDLTGLALVGSSIVRTNGPGTRVAELGSRFSALGLRSKALLRVSPPKPIQLQSAMKRGLDIMIASLLLIATFPVSITIATSIAISCGLPVLFKQKRVTKGGRPFTMLKFRTMRTNANRLLPDGHADPTVPFFKVRSDPRITRIGAFLRKCSLDELPQLLNVVRGDMSLVGPRPLPIEQVEANRELLTARHEVRAGITGWWQVNGRNNVTPDQALALDRFYVENWSLALDLRILLKTPSAVLTRRGAY